MSLLPFTTFINRHLGRRRFSVRIITILLVVGVTIQFINIQSSRAPLTLRLLNETVFPALENFWKNDNSVSEGIKSPVSSHGDGEVHSSPPLFQWNDEAGKLPPPNHDFLADKSENGEARKQSSDGLLEGRDQNFQKICQPKSHVVFLKTHKTASSTVQNILYRYGENNGLTFALPRNKHNQLSYPLSFRTRFVNGVENNMNFDIMCNHMRFNKSEVKKLMPEDSFYFSILRNPVTMMESIYIYYKGLGVFSKTKSLDDFLDNGLNNISVKNNYAHNNLAFDFGFDNTATADTPNLETIVHQMIAEIEQDFHLILISEYFDESMILLKHALCWSLEDVVSFRLNSRTEQSRKNISLATTEKIKRWNVLDWRIYKHFNTTFWHKVRTLVGEEEMKREVAQLKELQEKLTSSCLVGGEAVNPKEIKDKAVKPFQSGAAVIEGYLLNPDLDVQTNEKCLRLIMPEIQYTKFLFEKQFPEITLKGDIEKL